MNIKLSLTNCTKEYWEFVRLLRMHEAVQDGFIEKQHITPEQQIKYMHVYQDCYRIALLDKEPVGYFGVIDNDIRICVHPDHQSKGVGKFLVTSCRDIWPEGFAKIKFNNTPSKKLFESCGYKLKYHIYEA